MITAHSSFNTENAKLAKRIIVALEIDGYDRVFTNYNTGVADHYPWITEVGDLSWEVSALDGTSSLNDLNVTVLDRGRAILADLPGVTLEGKVCRLKTGFPGMSYANFVTLFTGYVDSVPTSEGNNCFQFICKDSRQNLKQLIYTIGDDGQPTDTDHPKTVIGHPLDIAISVFDSLGLTLADYDYNKLIRYRDEIFGGMQFDFTITSPPEGKAWLESQIFKPLGGYLRVTNLGVLTPQFFTPLAGTITPALALTRDNLVGIPDMEQADLVNVVQYKMDKSGDSYLFEWVVQDSDSVAKYGQQGINTIEADGVKSAFQGVFTAELTAEAVFGRFGDKNPRFSATGLWSTCLLELGDLPPVTHNLMPNRAAGTLGLTDALFEIEGMSLNFMEGTVRFSLVDAGYLQAFGAYRIAPDDVPAWTLATTEQKDRYMFISDATGEYSDATPGHPLA